MKTTPTIDRRTLLKGIGGVAIGLPLLEEMVATRAVASTVAPAAEAVPVRAFNVFFGLGIPAPLQSEGFDGVLEPLKPLGEKLLILRDVDQIRCDQSGINAHYDGASGAFTAEPPNGSARSGGPSLDQVVRHAHYSEGLPVDVVPSLVAGTYFRRSRVSRYVHSYNADGTIAGQMQESPRALFARVFGDVPTEADARDPRSRRLRRSVLDAVVSQYRFYTGARSPLGATSKSRVAEHLDRIREYERRAWQLQRDVRTPESPPESDLLHGDAADPGGQGIDITLEALVEEWRLLADLYALAIQCDRARFGSLTFLAAGERIRLTGDYQYEGRTLFTFDDARQLDASGDLGCSHEWWHKFNESKTNDALRAHGHMKMREVAYFLDRLDSPDCLEPNGRTILENSLITISTESGDGRHSDPKRELSGVFHAITGANGRFKTGQFLDLGAEGLDLYNTILGAMGAGNRLGPDDRDPTAVDAIRV